MHHCYFKKHSMDRLVNTIMHNKTARGKLIPRGFCLHNLMRQPTNQNPFSLIFIYYSKYINAMWNSQFHHLYMVIYNFSVSSNYLYTYNDYDILPSSQSLLFPFYSTAIPKHFCSLYVTYPHYPPFWANNLLSPLTETEAF